jgi:hypothetical protein
MISCFLIHILIKNMNLLILTTLPHFLSVLPLVPFYLYKEIFWYVNLIIISTILSIIYHIPYPKNNKFITFIDHFFALLWFLFDLYIGYSISKTAFIKILMSNTASFFIHQKIDVENYYFLHSIWHLINATKCCYVSYVICVSIL